MVPEQRRIIGFAGFQLGFWVTVSPTAKTVWVLIFITAFEVIID